MMSKSALKRSYLNRILDGESVRQVLDETSEISEAKKVKGTGKPINYEDDLVKVYDKKGNEIYSGMEDYEPMKYEDWVWDKKSGYYTFKDYIKVCL